MKRILMVAFQYPPMAGTSGTQRTLRFAEELPALGWQPRVLTVHPSAYVETDPAPGAVPPATPLLRTGALDTARHLSLFGKYPGWLARPDRWVSWLATAVPAGLRAVRRFRPDVLWSTYPIATAHLVGYWIARLTGLPWVADFRDPMAHDGYPADPAVWRSFLRTEQKVFAQARRMVFVTDGAAALYRSRYPAAAARVAVIENGYDEGAFQDAAAASAGQAPPGPGPTVLLHSGVVYPEWRHPGPLFAALRALLDAGSLAPGDLVLRFRASGHDDFIASLARTHGVQQCVQVLPALGYRAALAEMLQADALLLLQSGGCNDQIPAKAYEYLRAGRPVLALTDPAGDTAGLMRRAGLPDLAALDDAPAIAQALARFVQAVRAGGAARPQGRAVESMSRARRSAELAVLLDQVAAEHRDEPGRGPARRNSR